MAGFASVTRFVALRFEIARLELSGLRPEADFLILQHRIEPREGVRTLSARWRRARRLTRGRTTRLRGCKLACG